MGTPIEVVTGYLAAFAEGDADAIAGFVSEGFRNEHLSALGSSGVGRDEYRRRLPDFLASFPDRRYLVDDIVEQRRDEPNSVDVVVRYRFCARYGDDEIEIPGVMWFSTVGGSITKRVDVWDSLTFLRQTGAAD